jgi:hypothetical protein
MEGFMFLHSCISRNQSPNHSFSITVHTNTYYNHRNQTISRRWAYILADIHGMDHFCTKLAPRPYNKPRSCVSKIHTPMVMVWLCIDF